MPAPRKISDLLSEVITRRGYARIESRGIDIAAWTNVVGAELARLTRVGELRRGVLEVIAANNIVVAELGFQKARLLAELARRMPHDKLKDLRFKVGPVQ
jgi:predicted nucleic acid-binding Zn ribbon protein